MEAVPSAVGWHKMSQGTCVPLRICSHASVAFANTEDCTDDCLSSCHQQTGPHLFEQPWADKKRRLPTNRASTSRAFSCTSCSNLKPSWRMRSGNFTEQRSDCVFQRWKQDSNRVWRNYMFADYTALYTASILQRPSGAGLATCAAHAGPPAPACIAHGPASRSSELNQAYSAQLLQKALRRKQPALANLQLLLLQNLDHQSRAGDGLPVVEVQVAGKVSEPRGRIQFWPGLQTLQPPGKGSHVCQSNIRGTVA